MKKTLTTLALASSLTFGEGVSNAQEETNRVIHLIAEQVKTIKNTGYKIDINNTTPFNKSIGNKDLELDIEGNTFDITIFTKEKIKELGIKSTNDAVRIANGNLEIIKQLINEKNTNDNNNSK